MKRQLLEYFVLGVPAYRLRFRAATTPPTIERFCRRIGEVLGLRRFVRLAMGRWHIEQDYGQIKEELGLDHFQGRFTWAGTTMSRW